MHVLATAGHVDHGKSTLVEWLTGIDPDRLAEEKARGLTIDLGFAWTTLPSGRELSLVDVPGHVRFLRNMLAGVGAVDACLFVVAATEGWKPQSEEHLRIMELLGVEHGVVALTKAAVAGPEMVQRAREETTAHLAGTALASAPIVDVDPPAGLGRSALVEALERTLARTPTASDQGRPRLWIDRRFAAPGAGVVVTGTLTGGSLAVGDDVSIAPGPAPGRQPLHGRVRALQSHRQSLDIAGPGRRLAVNLRGIGELSNLVRGQGLVRTAQWAPTSRFDATLRVLDAAPSDVGRRGAYVAYVGSGEWPVRLRVLGRETVPVGGEAAVRLHLPVALPLLPGDRYVLRDAGRRVTIGGGAVLDVAPVLPASRAHPDRSVDRVVSEREWVEVAHLEQLTGERRPADLGRYVVDPQVLRAATDRVEAAIAEAGVVGLAVATLDQRDRLVLEHLVDSGRAVVQHGHARPEGADATALLRSHPFLRTLDATPFRPPDPAAAGIAPAELRQLVVTGLVVERDGVYFSARALDDAATAVQALLRAQHDGVTAADVRVALGTTRKYVLPLLGLLDARGVTRRRGDVRVPGPALVDEVPA